MNIAIVVAGGKGKRIRKRVNKLFLLLNKEPIIFHTLKIFQDCKDINQIILVVNPNDKDKFKSIVKASKFDKIKQLYETVLYKKDIPSMFIEADKRPFLGKIIGVSKEGKLKIELEDEKLREFSLKEIEFA